MNKPIGAIDGDKVFEWMYSNGYFSLKAADMIADEWEKGSFNLEDQSESTGIDVLSGQLVDEVQLHAQTAAENVIIRGEATRLREALKEVKRLVLESKGRVWTGVGICEVVNQALSSSQRDEETKKVREIWDGLSASGNLTGMDALEKSLIVLGIPIPGITEER